MAASGNLHLRAIVVDDEPLAARRLARGLDAEPGVAVVGVCHDAATALHALRETRCDVLFLDVQMPGGDGMALARNLPETGAPLVVFVTAHSEFAPEAFGLDAVDYLLKPVETARLRAALARVRKRLQADEAVAEIAKLRASAAAGGSGAPGPGNVEIWAPTGQGAVRLFPDQIEWIGSEDDYVRLHVTGQSYLLRSTLQQFVSKVAPEDFVRVHRSAAVNLDRVVGLARLPYGALSVELASGQHIRVSRSHAPALRRRLRQRVRPREDRPA